MGGAMRPVKILCEYKPGTMVGQGLMKSGPVASEAALGTSSPLCGHQQGWSPIFPFLLFLCTLALHGSAAFNLGTAVTLAFANQLQAEGTCVTSGWKPQ